MRLLIIFTIELFRAEVKIIPLNIGELLTPIGLAYWFMDDGYAERSGYMLCTDSFSEFEID